MKPRTATGSRQHIDVIAIDTIPFFGGSKQASHVTLTEYAAKTDQRIHIISAEKSYWKQAGWNSSALLEFAALQRCEQGIPYFIRHLIISIQIGWRILWRGKPKALIGLSGPGNDIAMYWCATLFNLPCIQLVHGPVAASKTLAKALKQAGLVAYLPSSLASISHCMGASRFSLKTNAHFTPLKNGLASHQWPTTSVSSFDRAHIFWAASLLRWKGLNTLVDALKLHNIENASETRICYIQPKNTQLECVAAPLNSKSISAFESPKNLDTHRSECNIFVSTAKNEPFGLSILEALAAGLCVVIPNDGAYWDTQLTHKVNCIKYTHGSATSLADALNSLANNMEVTKRIAEQGQLIANQYRAEQCIKPLIAKMATLSITPYYSQA